MVTALILLSAILHASWNAFVKGDPDRTLSMAWIMGLGGVATALALPFVGFPAREVWPFLIVTVILQNIFFGFVILSYRHGDLSQAYPIARGVAALTAALVSSLLGLDVLVPREWLGIVVSSLGIASLAFAAADKGVLLRRSIGYPLMSGVFTAAYSIVDGMGARVSGNAGPLVTSGPAPLPSTWTCRHPGAASPFDMRKPGPSVRTPYVNRDDLETITSRLQGYRGRWISRSQTDRSR